MKKHFIFLKQFQTFILIGFLFSLSLMSFLFYSEDGRNLLYADAISRLDIARKVIDNITPGLPQLGNVWLPLPQILMIPFIWNKYLWHSGIAGYIMSGSMFILGGLFIYKSAKLLSNSFIASIFSLSLYALNINVLYLQTTAMSESIFLTTLSATIYFFLRWFYTHNNSNLVLAALSVSAMTLIRYEGLAILLSSIPMVFIYSYIKYRKFSKAEANTILFSTLACLGFALWTIYLTAIFGDPLYWKNFYASEETRLTYTGEVSGFTQNLSFLSASWKYFTSFVWMSGLIPVVLALVSIVIMIIKSIKDKTWYFIPMLMPLSIFLFMILTLQRNTPIVQPTLSILNIFSSETSTKIGFNIRYGLLLIPWVAIMVSYLFIFKSRLMKVTTFIILSLLFSIQVYSYFYPGYSTIYKIPVRIESKPNAALVEYMQKNYDGGPILISASGHEDQMFEMGFDYKTYIHEGTNKYWKESLDDPPRYAKWVILDKGQNADKLAQKPGIEEVLDRDYNLVFEKEQVKIFKIKTKPYYEI